MPGFHAAIRCTDKDDDNAVGAGMADRDNDGPAPGAHANRLVLTDRRQTTENQASTNDLHADTGSTVIQARDISGGVHVDSPPMPALPRPHQAPPAAAIIGRDAILRDITAAAAPDGSGKPKILVLHGPPGVGKTSAVLNWVFQHAELFPDGVLFADFHDFDSERPASCEEIFDGFLRGLGLSSLQIPAVGDAQAALFRSLTIERQMLILLDNVGSADRVRAFLTAGSSTHLITSRNRLNGLIVRHAANAIAIPFLDDTDAVAVLTDSMEGTRSATEAKAIADLATLCGNLPLALRIAASQLRENGSVSVAEHVEHLRAVGEVTGLSTDSDEASRLAAVFSWSYRTLRDDAARVFRAICNQPGRDISRDAVSAATELPPAAVSTALHELIDGNLIQSQLSNRYSAHDPLRGYGRDESRSAVHMEDSTATLARLVHWYVGTAANANEFMTPGRVERQDVPLHTVGARQFRAFDDALKWLDAERGNFVDIIRSAHAIGDFASAAVLPNLLWGYFNLTKHWPDWISCNDAGLVAARDRGDRRSEAYLLTSQGVALRNLRMNDRAQECHLDAEQILEELEEFIGLAYARQNRANVLTDIGDFDTALQCFHSALNQVDAAGGDPRAQAVTRNSLAVCLNSMGRFADGLDAAVNAHQALTELGDEHGQAFALHSIGLAYLGLKDLQSAHDALTSAVTLRNDISDRYGRGRSLLALGDVLAASGDEAAARAAWQSAFDIFTVLGAPEQTDALSRLAPG